MNLRDIFRRAGTSVLSDAMGRAWGMRGIYSVVPGAKVAGRAFTVRTYPGDWAKPIEAIEMAEHGDVIVISAAGGGRAVWGELASRSAIKRGIAGVVVDGYVRDVEGIRSLGFPVFARGHTPTAGNPRGVGEINVEVECGGVRVRPGDWVVGDDDGVVVVPIEVAEEVAAKALEILRFEKKVVALIEEGRSLREALDILGYKLG